MQILPSIAAELPALKQSKCSNLVSVQRVVRVGTARTLCEKIIRLGSGMLEL